MKRTLLVLIPFLIATAGCQTGSQSGHGKVMRDPAGAQTNSVDSQARDIYQRPYPGSNPYSPGDGVLSNP